MILKEEGLNFNSKPISKQNSKNSIFGEFSKVVKNTWALMGVIIFILLLIRNQRMPMVPKTAARGQPLCCRVRILADGDIFEP